MDIRDLIRTIKKIEADCTERITKEGTSGNWEHQKDSKVDYEKFYHRIMGATELADEDTRPSGGGTYG